MVERRLNEVFDWIHRMESAMARARQTEEGDTLDVDAVIDDAPQTRNGEDSLVFEDTFIEGLISGHAAE